MLKKLLVSLVASAFALTAFAQAPKSDTAPASPTATEKKADKAAKGEKKAAKGEKKAKSTKGEKKSSKGKAKAKSDETKADAKK